MIKIAIVEDTNVEAEVLTKYLKRFEKEHDESFHITRFVDADDFLDSMSAGFEIVFFDIALPTINGVEASKKLREMDKNIVIIFVTNMAQFALKGYEVDALDYILKPINYQKILFKMHKAIKLARSNRKFELIVSYSGGVTRISTDELVYVEVLGHTLTYHMVNNKLKGRGTLKKLEKELVDQNFMRCNNPYLVNPKFIKSIDGFDLHMLNGDILKISQPRKKVFMKELAEWLGQGNK